MKKVLIEKKVKKKREVSVKVDNDEDRYLNEDEMIWEVSLFTEDFRIRDSLKLENWYIYVQWFRIENKVNTIFNLFKNEF